MTRGDSPRFWVIHQDPENDTSEDRSAVKFRLFRPRSESFGIDRTAVSIAMVCVGLALSSVVASEPEVESFHWGFDGRAVAPAFNPLTVIIHNPGEEDLRGELELTRLRGGYWPVGLPIRLPVFVSRGTRRPVRFYPYILGEYDGWRLDWIDAEGTRRELNTSTWKLRLGEPATVLLVGPDRLTSRSGRLRSLDESWFPSVSTATEGLAGVVLDHVPRWQSVRRRVFLEWLSHGGTLHLLNGPDGRPVVLGGDFRDLAGGGTLTRYGSGRVIRHGFGVDEIPATFPTRTAPVKRDAAATSMAMYGFDPYGSIDDSAMFSALRSMTRPVRNWPLIYLVCLVYMAVLFPGGFAYGQGERDYRVVLGVLALVVLVFSGIFFLVGRRDDAARLTIRTASMVHHLGDGDLEYQQWVEAAVTHGGNYRFTHKGRSRLYSTAQNLEKSIGRIEHGGDAAITVDVPPYSSSTFLVRGRLPGESIGLTPTVIQAEGGHLQGLVLSTGEGFPARIRQAAALVGDRFYWLIHSDGVLQLDQSASTMLRPSYRGDGRMSPSFDPEFDRYVDVDEAYEGLYEALVFRSLGFTNRTKAVVFQLPPGRIRVFVYAAAPESLEVQVDESADQIGFVLHSWDFQTVSAP